MRLKQLNRGHRGGVITMHRALNHLHMGPGELLNSGALVLFAVIVWLMFLPKICLFWVYVFRKGLNNLPLQASLGVSDRRISSLHFVLPYLRIDSVLPDSRIWGYTCIITLVLFACSYLLTEKWTPIVYLLRGILIIQITALTYFAVMPARFPHTPDSYIKGLVSSGIALISAVPFLFSFTYYIFCFSALKKIFLTLFVMAYLVIFLPFQVLLQALILQKSVLFMPLLYVVLGMPLDILLIISFYSYGMTWETTG